MEEKVKESDSLKKLKIEMKPWIFIQVLRKDIEKFPNQYNLNGYQIFRW